MDFTGKAASFRRRTRTHTTTHTAELAFELAMGCLSALIKYLEVSILLVPATQVGLSHLLLAPPITISFTATL